MNTNTWQRHGTTSFQSIATIFDTTQILCFIYELGISKKFRVMSINPIHRDATLLSIKYTTAHNIPAVNSKSHVMKVI